MSTFVNPFDANNFGVVQEIGASPVAGSNYVGAVPANARSALALISFLLVADANVANRYAEMQLHRGADVYVFGHSFSAHTATLTKGYLAMTGAGVPSVIGTNRLLFSLTDVPLFLEADTVRIVVVNIQATDQLSEIRLHWKIWPYEQ